MKYKKYIEDNSICNLRHNKYLVLITNIVTRIRKIWDMARIELINQNDD